MPQECAWAALQDDPHAEIPESLKKLAIAVECFHKASLIHDDIEDEDAERYGQPSLHAEYGVPVAPSLSMSRVTGHDVPRRVDSLRPVKPLPKHVAVSAPSAYATSQPLIGPVTAT